MSVPRRCRPVAGSLILRSLIGVGLLLAFGAAVTGALATAPPPRTSPTPPQSTAPAMAATDPPGEGSEGVTPQQVVVSADGRRAWAVLVDVDAVAEIDLVRMEVVRRVAVGRHPTDCVLSKDGTLLYVSARWSRRVDVIAVAEGAVVRSFPAGLEPYGVALSPDGAVLFVTDALGDALFAMDSGSGALRFRVAVGRSPHHVVVTPDGSRVVVGNCLGRSVSIIGPERGIEVERRVLGKSSLLQGLALTPDGRFGIVAHVVSHDETFPVQIERGWIHSNGVTVFDLQVPGHRVPLLLDTLLAGAAVPWGVTISEDGDRAWVSLAGVHEVAAVSVAALLQWVRETPESRLDAAEEDVDAAQTRRISRRSPAGVENPRGIVVYKDPVGRDRLLVAGAMEDALGILDASTLAVVATIPLRPAGAPSLRRRGEMLFNDARITYQGWFSCVSCHQEDATVDGLNWDLPNDGLGNTKNVKSLHDAVDTPPSMWAGVRTDADAAIRAGQRFQGFLPEEAKHAALVAFLAKPARAPNPYADGSAGIDAPTLVRGQRAFSKARCDTCHPGPLYTDLKKHDVGVISPDDPHHRLDTPSLRDCYRTAPYLHDGAAATLEDLWPGHDPAGLHGLARDLAPQEHADLLAWVRSL